MTSISDLSHLSGGWTVTRYILIIEDRICDCGSTHTAPAQFPRVQLVNRQGAIRSISMADLKNAVQPLMIRMQEEFRYPILPRSIQRITVGISACEHCFHTHTADEPDMLRTGPERFPLSITEIRQLIAYSEELNTTPELLREARDKRQTPSKPVPTLIIPLDLSLI